MYEFPNVDGHLQTEEVVEYCKSIGLMPVFVKELPSAKHIFSHIEWHMTGYAIRVDELEKQGPKEFIFAHPEEIQKKYSIPAAFEAYTKYVNIRIGQNKYEE